MIRRLLGRVAFRRDHRFTERHMSAYLEGELPARAHHRVEGHVGVCPQCRRVFATLKRTVRSLQALGAPARPGLSEGIIERLPRA